MRHRAKNVNQVYLCPQGVHRKTKQIERVCHSYKIINCHQPEFQMKLSSQTIHLSLSSYFYVPWSIIVRLSPWLWPWPSPPTHSFLRLQIWVPSGPIPILKSLSAALTFLNPTSAAVPAASFSYTHFSSWNTALVTDPNLESGNQRAHSWALSLHPDSFSTTLI